MQTPQVPKYSMIEKQDEDILVVPRDLLFDKVTPWFGINQDALSNITNIVAEHAAYIPRQSAEHNPEYKQIIPYIIFTHQDKFFVMQRKAQASEKRLAGKFSIGIGGHVRKEDIVNHDIMDWARREFEEEVTYDHSFTTRAIGVLNDDTNDVGKVHIGLIIIAQGSSDQISIKDEHKSGTLLTLEECQMLSGNMESWSTICLDFIQKNPILVR